MTGSGGGESSNYDISTVDCVVRMTRELLAWVGHDKTRKDQDKQERRRYTGENWQELGSPWTNSSRTGKGRWINGALLPGLQTERVSE